MTEILASYARVPQTRAGLPAADEPRVDITLSPYTDPLAAVRAVRDAASSVVVEILRRAQEQG